MGGTVYRRFTVVTMVEGRFCGECTVPATYKGIWYIVCTVVPGTPPSSELGKNKVQVQIGRAHV